MISYEWVLTVLTLLACIPHVHSANPFFLVTLSLETWEQRMVASWSGGGGKRSTLTNETSWPFPGREFGGGDRKTIYGTRLFGSGYPYGGDDSSTVAGRPFPYGLWPLYWGNDYLGSDEYGPHVDLIRPGGPIVVAPLTKGAITNDTYYIMGDRSSVHAIMLSMTTWCHANPALPVSFTVNSTFRPENVIQYYRASSFALLSPLYNNTKALPENISKAPTAESDPLPNEVVTSDFRKCIDGAIGNAIPIVDGLAKEQSLGVTLGIVFGIFGIPILATLGWILGVIVACCCG